MRSGTIASLDWVPPAPRLPGPYKHYLLGDGSVVDPELDCLGVGGFGSVWAALSDTLPDLLLAIKFLHGASFEFSQGEAELSSRLHHSHILPIRDFLDLRPYPEWGVAALVMPRCQMSLDRLLAVLRQSGQHLPLD